MPLVSVDVQAIPIMHTENAVSLISDSGITRYRLEAKVWDMYSNAGDPYSHFPEGIHVERFDSLFQVIGSIKADTAYYYEKKDLWHALGNVVVKNLEGTTFETSELFWDRKIPPGVPNAFYTYKYTKITKPDGTIIEGYKGFRADQSLSAPILYSGKVELNVEESSDSLNQSAIRSDSI